MNRQKIKLCYEVEQQNEQTHWCVGSVMESNYDVICSYKNDRHHLMKKLFYNENHTLIAYINNTANHMITENSEIISDNQHKCSML